MGRWISELLFPIRRCTRLRQAPSVGRAAAVLALTILMMYALAAAPNVIRADEEVLISGLEYAYAPGFPLREIMAALCSPLDRRLKLVGVAYWYGLASSCPYFSLLGGGGSLWGGVPLGEGWAIPVDEVVTSLMESFADDLRDAVVQVVMPIPAVLFVGWLVSRRRIHSRRRQNGWCLLKLVAVGSLTWLWAMLLLLGLSLTVVALGLTDRTGTPAVYCWEAYWLLGCFCWPAVVMAVIGLQAGEAVGRMQPMDECVYCGYSLIGLTEPRCPECGQPFPPLRGDGSGLHAGARAVECSS